MVEFKHNDMHLLQNCSAFFDEFTYSAFNVYNQTVKL